MEKAAPQFLQSSAKKKTEYKIRSNLRQIFYSGAPARRRRVSRAPSPKKIGKHIETRKFDVTVRTSVRTDSKGGGMESQGNPNGAVQECHVFLAGFLRKRKLISICYVNK